MQFCWARRIVRTSEGAGDLATTAVKVARLLIHLSSGKVPHVLLNCPYVVIVGGLDIIVGFPRLF